MTLPQLLKMFENTPDAKEEDERALNHILSHGLVTTVYQPIVDLTDGHILGYEALSRGPENSPYYSPVKLLELAHRYCKIWEIEMLFRTKALEKAYLLESQQSLFINVDPDVMKTDSFQSGLTKDYISKQGLNEQNIVFEITERTAITDYVSFQAVLDNYRHQGYKIAIDDVGAGYSGLKTLTEVKPNFLKVDMDLIRNIDKDAFKQALIKAFVETSQTTNITIIAEGIETKEELKTLILLGVHAGQGFFLQQPKSEILPLPQEVVNRILDYNQLSNNINSYSQDYHYISHLVTHPNSFSFEPMTQSATVKSHIESEQIKSVCICERDQPVGIVMKYNLDAIMSGQYGYAVFSNRPISKIMNASPLIVDFYTPINVVAKKAMGRNDEEIFDDIIVTKGSAFYGLVSMKKIFEYTIMYEKNNAKELNPLTGLPGNPIINRVLTDSVGVSGQSCVLYVDINEFKIYNDVYGFERGDSLIKYLADMLKEEVKRICPYTSFIGHVGGDDFIVVFEGDVDKYNRICKNILERFEKERKQFFSEDHIQCNMIVSEDRFGVVREFKLTSLSIAGIYGDLSLYESNESLSEALAKLKKKVKKKGDNFYQLKTVNV